MKPKTYIIAALLVIAAGIVVYVFFGSGGGQRGAPTAPVTGPTTSNPVPPVMVSGTVPASSYGAGAVGTQNATSVSLSAPVSSAQLSRLMGMAKPAPGSGAHPDFTAMKLALYDPKTNQELTSVDLSADGSYQFIVEPGEYVLNFVPGAGSSAQLPQRISLSAGQVQNLNFFVK